VSSTPSQLRALYHLTDENTALVKKVGEFVVPRLQNIVDAFYAWLEPRPEFDEFFSDKASLERVISAQVPYWKQFYAGEIDEAYVEHRRHVGHTHARIGLPLEVYFGAMNAMAGFHLDEIYADGSGEEATLQITLAVNRQMHLDTGIVVEAYNSVVSSQLTSQSTALMKMSTPVTQIWAGILMMPIVGIIDSKRAQDIMNTILASIADSKAQHFILDISGVAVVDTAVANHLIKITRATALMGCECIISGISSAIAQTIVELGIDVGAVRTTAAMKDALAMVFTAQGVELVQTKRVEA
jgi:rsbT co-antagonist protein RsbR